MANLNQRLNDEAALIDLMRGELTADEREQIERRLAGDENLRRLHGDISNAFKTLDLLPEAEAPADLAASTLNRLRQARRTEALLQREESRRLSTRPTFSLRELTAIAATFILMAVIFVPSIQQARRMAKVGECASQAGQIGSALLTYANSNDGRLPAATAETSRWLPTGSEAAFSNSSALYKLIAAGYADSRLFQCPAGEQSGFVVRSGMTDFPGNKFVGYSYQHSAGGAGLRSNEPAMAGVTGSMAILADSTPVFPEAKFDPRLLTAQASGNHGRTGQNVLYLDMHVGWAPTAQAGVNGDNIFLVDGVSSYRGDEAPARPTDTFLLPAFSPVSMASAR